MANRASGEGLPITVPKTAAVCVLRDAADLALLICSHYLRIGFARVVIIDDGSSDGSHERLLDLARRSKGQLEIQRNLGNEDGQPELFSHIINALVADGYRLIVPFDADEFWQLSNEDLQALAQRELPRVIYGEWINFVQDRNRHYPTPLGLLAMRRRTRVSSRDLQQKVLAREEPFIHLAERKIAIWTDSAVRIGRGQHHLEQGPTASDPRSFSIFHLPLRYRSELTKRGLNYEPRRSAGRTDPGISWQSAFHRQVVLEDQVEEVWAANSADKGGRLNVYGRAVQLAPDQRLRLVLIKAALYLISRHRMLPF